MGATRGNGQLSMDKQPIGTSRTCSSSTPPSRAISRTTSIKPFAAASCAGVLPLTVTARDTQYAQDH